MNAMRHSTRYGLACVIAIYAFLQGNARAAERDLWHYPCDVYMSPACLRLPDDMSVSYKVPIDFGIYTVTSSGKEVVSVYVGNAPQLPHGNPSLRLDSAVAALSGFLVKQDGINKLDIVLAPKKKDGTPIVHVFASFSDDQRTDVATVVSGLRACQQRGKEDLWCPAEGQWGKAIQDWVDAQVASR